MGQTRTQIRIERDVLVPSGNLQLEGELNIPAGASGVVLFAHGSGSSRHSPRNTFVRRAWNVGGGGAIGSRMVQETLSI